MATAEPYFGPEIVDRPIGSQTVREQKAATALIIGTAPIHLVHADGAARAPYINTKVIVRDRKEIAQWFGPETDGYDLPSRLDAIFDQAEDSGIGTLVVVNVFDPDVHKDVGNAPDPSQVANTDIIGTFDASGKASGLKLAYECFQAFGWFPKNLDAGFFSNDPGVRAELEVIQNRIRARSGLNAPIGVTRQDVIEARGPTGAFDFQTNSRRFTLHWPSMLKISETTGNEINIPYSSVHLGVWLRSIIEYGYHHSPSNRPIYGMEDSAQEVHYIPGDHQSDPQLLRGAGVVTVEERWGKGIHTSGNRSAAYPTDTDYRNFNHVQYTTDMIDEAVLFYLDDWKDRNASAAAIEFIEERINRYVKSKTTGDDPALYDGRFWFDRTQTTPESVAEGQFFYQLDIMPVSVMERITVERGINIELVRNPLGLANSAV